MTQPWGILLALDTIDKELSLLLKAIPILRDDETESLFNQVIQQHIIYSFYFAGPRIWKEFLNLVCNRHNDSSISITINRIKDTVKNKYSPVECIRFAEDYITLGEKSEAAKLLKRFVLSNNSDLMTCRPEVEVLLAEILLKFVKSNFGDSFFEELCCCLVNRFTKGFYNIDILERFLADNENFQMIKNSNCLQALLDYFLLNYDTTRSSFNSYNLFYILESIICTNIVNRSKYIADFVHLIITMERGLCSTSVENFFELKEILENSNDINVVHDKLGYYSKNSVSRVMNEILFGQMKEADLLEVLNDIYRLADIHNKAEILFHLLYYYGNRFCKFCQVKLDESSIGNFETVRIDTLLELNLICSQIGLTNYSNELAKVISCKINNELVGYRKLLYITTYMENICFSDRIHSRQLMLVEHEIIGKAVLNSLSSINNDSMIEDILVFLIKNMELGIDLIDPEADEYHNFANVQKILKVYREIIYLAKEKLQSLNSILVKTIVKDALRKYKELKQASHNTLVKSN